MNNDIPSAMGYELRMPSSSRHRVLLARVASIMVAACCACTSSGSGSSYSTPTLVTVSPAAFGRGVLCAGLPGAWKSYVATLTDVTFPDKPFVLASSNPTPCTMPVSFSWVVPGHKYIADIDGYEQDGLVSFGGYSSGSRHVVDQAGEEVVPRWKTSCGKSFRGGEHDAGADADSAESPGGDVDDDVVLNPTTSYRQSNVIVAGCAPLSEMVSGDTETGLVVDLSTVRGALSCGTEPGQVASYRVVPAEPSLVAVDAACDESLIFSPVESGKVYRFFVEAYESGSVGPRWATTCERRPASGVVLPASCDLLSSQGALRVNIGDVLSQVSLECANDDIASYRASVVGTSSATPDLSCAEPAMFHRLKPASYQVLVDAFDAAGRERMNAFCVGSVRVGVVSDVDCWAKTVD